MLRLKDCSHLHTQNNTENSEEIKPKENSRGLSSNEIGIMKRLYLQNILHSS